MSDIENNLIGKINALVDALNHEQEMYEKLESVMPHQMKTMEGLIWLKVLMDVSGQILAKSCLTSGMTEITAKKAVKDCAEAFQKDVMTKIKIIQNDKEKEDETI